MAISVLTRPNQSSQFAYQTVAFTDTVYVEVNNIPTVPFVKILLNDVSVQAVFNEHVFNEIVFNGDEVISSGFIKFHHVYDEVAQQLLIGFDQKQSGTLYYTY